VTQLTKEIVTPAQAGIHLLPSHAHQRREIGFRLRGSDGGDINYPKGTANEILFCKDVRGVAQKQLLQKIRKNCPVFRTGGKLNTWRT
jgi:hypothetical protein